MTDTSQSIPEARDPSPSIQAARLPAPRRSLRRGYAGLPKRGLDLGGALILGSLFLPLMLILAALVRAGGPQAIFGHERIGRDGRRFRCLKFRTMVPDAEARLAELLARDPDARAQWDRARKLDRDPRITRLGGFLRRTSLDELPQLWNVLRGEMSLVGPRPVTADELGRYGDCLAAYLSLRPGLTGPWQVNGRNDISYAERVRMDHDYAQRLSLGADLAILARTVLVVLGATGR